MTNTQSTNLNRRQFLESSAKTTAGVAAGMVGLSSATAQAKKSPSEQISLGVIGLRNQGLTLAKHLAEMPNVRIHSLCDVDANQLGTAAVEISSLQQSPVEQFHDFRSLLDQPEIDGVVIATPDHWHALMTIMACQAGKDVYVEKPVSHNLREGEQMVLAARKYGRVVQSGLQQRSGAHFQSAIELVQSGKLGEVHLAKAWVTHRRKPIGGKPDIETPEGVNYDLWLGPAPERAFNLNHFHQNWHWFWNYGTGELGNWGVHLLDVARWGLNLDLPERISASGGKYHFDDDQETPDTLMVQYSYPETTLLWEHRLWTHHGIEGRSAAVAFYGELGTLIVDRGGWKVYGQKESLTANASELRRTHLMNFLDCIRSRELPTADIEIGHLSSALCHLGNIASRLGRELNFNPEKNNFGKDLRANRLLSREYREPWTLPVL